MYFIPYVYFMMKFMFVEIFVQFKYIYLLQTKNLRNGLRKTLSVWFKNSLLAAQSVVHPLKAGEVMCFFGKTLGVSLVKQTNLQSVKIGVFSAEQ